MTKKAWSGRFSGHESPLMERFNASLEFDQRLYKQDIEGSLAHAAMLHKQGLLTSAEHHEIRNKLEKILHEFAQKKVKFSASEEDIHMAIESRLGEVGKKLHTGRSRNDQVALDTRLFVREQTKSVLSRLQTLGKIVCELAQKNRDTVLPGYTHLQRAQPILLAHHLLAYGEMFFRDLLRFEDNLKRLDQCPLGAGALAGSTLPLDRKMVAHKLNFTEPTRNSLDTVSDRDFVLDFLYAASVLQMHLSRLSEELVIWSTQEFDFITLPQSFCTGSSMMPQKINPDAPELIRGKTGRVYGNLISLLTTMKGLPLAYNKDMQEDKEPLFDSLDTITDCLDVLIAMLPDVVFHKNKMQKALKEGFVLATDVADYLAMKAVPFRTAHETVGKIVQYCLKENLTLEELDVATYKKFHKVFSDDIKEILQADRAVDARTTVGGTASTQVKKETVRLLKKFLRNNYV